jgi:RimJ/RimL family protein N-acetyltransferase
MALGPRPQSRSVAEARLPLEISHGGIRLRQWAAGDFGFYAAYTGNEVTARYYGGAMEAQKAWRHLASVIGHWTLRGFGVYAAEDSGRGELQGCVGVWEPHGWPCREFAYWFLHEAYDTGWALSAVQLALDEVKRAFVGEEVMGFIHPENARALSLARSIGATLQGEVPLFEFGLHVQVSFFAPQPSVQTQR